VGDTSLYSLPKGIVTRWASAESPDAAKGAAGRGLFGRKGRPCVPLKAGECLPMAHGEGSGIIRRMWITISDRSPLLMRGIVLRMYWDGETKPAVEAPIGDFFCQPLGRPVAFQNAWFDNPEGRSFNCRIPMPFRKGFRITATNESPVDLAMFFYDVDFTLGDEHGPDIGYFHAHYRRENPTTLRRDFEILPRVEGRGRFLGCSIGAIADTQTYGKSWWGEGEVKAYIDGDTDFPTLCGTGTEDYIGTGWGQGCYSMMWHGCPLADGENMQYSFYRLHGPDPVYFASDIRVTIQQIGCNSKEGMIAHLRASGLEGVIAIGDGSELLTADGMEAGQDMKLFERRDDWCAVAYFYLDRPVSTLSEIDGYDARVAGLGGV
jgi:hypothetical protein